MGILQEIKQRKFNSSQEKAVVNLMYTSNWLRDYQNKMFSAFKIKTQHYNVLRILKGSSPDPISPGAIKEVMLDKAPDLTRLLDKLAEMGYVDRHLCPDNRRKMDIFITPSGQKFIKEIDTKNSRELKNLQNRLSDKDAEMLSNLLDKFRG